MNCCKGNPGYFQGLDKMITALHADDHLLLLGILKMHLWWKFEFQQGRFTGMLGLSITADVWSVQETIIYGFKSNIYIHIWIFYFSLLT